MPEATALVVVKDLFFQTRLAGGLSQLGLRPAFVKDLAELAGLVTVAELAVIDLAARQVDPIEAIRRLRADRPDLPILAFGSHMDLETRQRALNAGATRVVANSQLTTDLPGLIRRLVPTAEAPQQPAEEVQ